MKFEERFLRMVIRDAAGQAGSGVGGPFAAMVVKDGEIIGSGVNRVLEKHDPTAHAEIEAIRDACRRLGHFQLDGCYLYSSCEPCPMCLGAIFWARPEAVFYAAGREDAASAGFDDSFIYRQIVLPDHLRTIPAFRYLAEEGKEPFLRWLDSPGSCLY